MSRPRSSPPAPSAPAESPALAGLGLTPPKVKLADHVYEQMLAQVASGKLQEGQKLPSESELGTAFGVSRPVIREALSRLRADGVIVSRHGSGSYVERQPHPEFMRLAPIGSVADLMRCFEFRVAVEGEAAYLAASRRSREDLAEIGRALKALETVITRGEVGVEADSRFHTAIARASKNKLFESTLETLAPHVLQGMNVARRLSLRASRERLVLVQEEHRSIYEAIAAEDAEAARAAMRTHVTNARLRVLTDSAEP